LLNIVHRPVHVGIQLLLYVYYFLKPAIPRGARFALRHFYAAPLKWMFASSWPIDPMSLAAPSGWPGWPDGKRFAFALSHDVEGAKGLARCRRLAELEMRRGFRSSFFFVPEGEYATPDELRQFLGANGFEVAVHDLHHDGTLYRSRSRFNDGAATINHYLKEWQAVGFRSGFMRHDLEWLGELDVRYDASTFDNDPFEPQPDGMHTVFPFWVRRKDGSAYVELPYTLVQDSTLFLVLREKSNDLWKRKLDWVAERGGMAFVIVHPDYMALDEPREYSEYPAAHYEDFLAYVNERYRDTAWCALPREIEEHVRRHLPLPAAMPVHEAAVDIDATRRPA
jgi:hypothetical protein